MVIKSLVRFTHLEDLEDIFKQLESYNVRLNPTKYIFCVREGRFIGYLITKGDIEVNLDRIITIDEMLSPNN